MQEVIFRSDMTVELIKQAASDADVIWAARVSTRGEQSLEEIRAEPDRSAGLIRLCSSMYATCNAGALMNFLALQPLRPSCFTV